MYSNNNEASSEDFRSAIHAAGLHPPASIIADGKLHRFASNGKPGDDAGYYVFHLDGIPAGVFGCWRADVRQKWHASGGGLSPQERVAHRARIDTMRRQVEAEDAVPNVEARKFAQERWEAAKPAPQGHRYLARKGVKSYGLRASGDELLVPVNDGDGLRSLQRIWPDGKKKFLPGCATAGCYFLIGELGETLCIAEGYATAASVHEATGRPVAVAFNAGNLPAAARALRSQYPNARLIICADDDAGTEGNPGQTKAREAAQAVAGLLAIPDFGGDRPDGATDFNDLHRHAGPEAVRACIDSARLPGVGVVEKYAAWPEPKPIIAELRPVLPFHADELLPAPLRDWIMDEAERMPCPPDFIAVAAVVALGSIIGARCAVKPKGHDSWLVVPNLWGAIVGDPSAKKSPAWSAALKPFDRLIAKALDTHRAALGDYESEKVVFEAHKEAIEGRIKAAAKKPGKDKDNPAAIAKELRTHRETAPATPTLRRYKTNDSTVEKLGELLRENPDGFLVLRDELVGLMASWDREGREMDRTFFLEAWGGNHNFDTDRIGRGHICIPNVCLSIFGGIQPDKLTVYLEQATNALANDGLLQRFQLLVYPNARRWEWRNRSPNKTARDAAFEVFEQIAGADPVVDWKANPPDDYAKFPYLCFDDEAQAIFIEWSADMHQGRIPNEEEPLIQQHLTKYDKLFPALALIFHLVDGGLGPVTKASALRAAAWCEYLETHARRCYGLLKDDGLRAAQALATKIERGALEDGFTLRDVRRNQWRSLTKEEPIQAALDWLKDEDWLRSESTGATGPGSGRPTRRYRINPAVKART